MNTSPLDLYLIIGLTKESRHWSNEFLQGLQSKLKPETIHLIDLPGSGKFLDQKSPMCMDEIVDQARKQIVFHPDRRRMVVAISLGGMVAWSWANRYPEDFTYMVMINSSMGGLSPLWKRVQPKAMIDFFKITSTQNPSKKEKYILDLCSNNREKADQIYPDWVKFGAESGMSFTNSIRQILAGMRFKPKQSPKIPILMIAAKYDRLAHFSCSEAIAKHAKVKLILNEDPKTGHAFHIDDPKFLVETIEEWVKITPVQLPMLYENQV